MIDFASDIQDHAYHIIRPYIEETYNYNALFMLHKASAKHFIEILWAFYYDHLLRILIYALLLPALIYQRKAHAQQLYFT